MLKRFFGPDGQPEREQFGVRGPGTGSGFVYDNRGHILTNNHVVEGAEKITVAFHDGTEAIATVVGTGRQGRRRRDQGRQHELPALAPGR